MKFGTFVFPVATDPNNDAVVMQEAVDEALLSEELGMDAVWVAEHHFDGNCVYVDPISFASALTLATKKVQIGTAVIQASLYHPIRLAEQISILDHLSKGRFLAGLGKGSMFNTYEYEAFEVLPEDAGARFDEVEDILFKSWTGDPVSHRGKFWNFDFPVLRPLPYTKPHPPYLRAVGSDESTIANAKKGRAFLMSGPPDMLLKRVKLARDTMAEAGFDAAHIANTVSNSWVWRHVCIANTDKEATEAGLAALEEYVSYREKLGLGSSFMTIFRKAMDAGEVPRGFLFGSPDTVYEKLAKVGRGGVEDLILRFAIGPMPVEQRLRSLRLFVGEVAPRLRDIVPDAVPAAAQ